MNQIEKKNALGKSLAFRKADISLKTKTGRLLVSHARSLSVGTSLHAIFGRANLQSVPCGLHNRYVLRFSRRFISLNFFSVSSCKSVYILTLMMFIIASHASMVSLPHILGIIRHLVFSDRRIFGVGPVAFLSDNVQSPSYSDRPFADVAWKACIAYHLRLNEFDA